MQVITKREFVQTSVKNKEIKFEVDQLHPEVMIKIVSDMYPDSRRTVTTEYVQNALDSHYEAGCPDKPIHVTLPTPLSPVYKVRDFGIGMTRETIENTFRYVFRSTKNQSDEALGGFGLGKLVFGAYSGVMDLLLYSGTQCEHYVVRLKDGDAGMTEVAKFPSNFPRGVEVRIPVYEDDCNYFVEQCRSVYALMPVRPVILGRPDFWEEVEQILDNEVFFQTKTANAKLFSSKIPYRANKATVLIGGIPFPIKEDVLMSLLEKQEYASIISKDQHSNIRTLLSSPLVISAKPGELEVVPSRDNIKYNRKSAVWLGTTLVQIYKELGDFITSKLLNTSTFLEAWQEIVPQVVVHEDSVLKKLSLKLCSELVWNNTMPVLGDLFEVWQLAFKYKGSYYTSRFFGTQRRYVDATSLAHEDYTGVLDFATTSLSSSGSRYTYHNSSTKRVFKDFLNIPLLKEFGDWTNKHVEKVGTMRETRSSNDTRTRCMSADLRAKLLPIAALLDNALAVAKTKQGGIKSPRWKVIIIDLNTCALAKSSRIINYNVVEDTGVITGESHFRIYTRGAKAKDFTKWMQKLKIGDTLDTFIDITDLETPPANSTFGTRTKKNASAGSTGDFGVNSLFTFNSSGVTPSDSFNDTFWVSTNNEELAQWKKDKTLRLFYVPVSAYKPVFNMDAKYSTLETSSASQAELAIHFRHSSSGFCNLVEYLFKQLHTQEQTSYKIIGVKAKKLPKGTLDIFQELDTFLTQHLTNISKFLQNRATLGEDNLALKAQLQNLLLNFLKNFEQTEKFKSKEATALRGVFLAFKKLVSNFKLGLTSAENSIVTNAFTSAGILILDKCACSNSYCGRKSWFNLHTMCKRNFHNDCTEFSGFLDCSEKLRELYEVQNLLLMGSYRNRYYDSNYKTVSADTLSKGAFLPSTYCSYHMETRMYDIFLDTYRDVFVPEDVAELSEELGSYFQQCAVTLKEVADIPLCSVTNFSTPVKILKNIEDLFKPTNTEQPSFLQALAEIFIDERDNTNYLPFLLQRTLQLLAIQASDLDSNKHTNPVQTDIKRTMLSYAEQFKKIPASVSLTWSTCLLCLYGAMLASILHEEKYQVSALFNTLQKTDPESAFSFLMTLLPGSFSFDFTPLKNKQ